MLKKTAVRHFKTQTKVAEICGITRQAVSDWDSVVPIKHAWKLERASGGKLSMRLGDYR